MGSSTVSIKNVERLISRCEDILGEKTKIRGQQLRIVKYVESLAEKINELDSIHISHVSADQLETFKQRLIILQEVAKEYKKQEKVTHQSAHLPDNGSTQISLSITNLKGSGLLRQSMTRTSQAMREELFSRQGSLNSSSLTKIGDDKEMTMAFEDHRRQQEKIAEDMIEMAKSLKHQSLAARDIIKSDTKVLVKTTERADENINGVHRETDRLKEKNKGCSWVIWIMLPIVFMVFIQMVVFIRFAPKRT